MRYHLLRSTLASLAFVVLVLPSAFAQTTERVSVDSLGLQGNGLSGGSFPAISADGRFVAFDSTATNLVPSDTDGYYDVFVRDRQLGQTARVSVDSLGMQGNGWSFGPAVSADGRIVAFMSTSTNLVPNDTNGQTDIFVHDRLTGITTRVSVDSLGMQVIGGSTYPSISADGLSVVFQSDAPNLVIGDTNGTFDAFLHDRQTGMTTRVSISSQGSEGVYGGNTPIISADGQFITFDSISYNFVPGDQNGTNDIFVHDLVLGLTTMVSVDSSGREGNRISLSPSISTDGRFVAFYSEASNLVPGDINHAGDVFLHDRQTSQTSLVSTDSAGVQGNFGSLLPSISADGRLIAFVSRANNLIAGDTNVSADVFVRDAVLGQTTRVSLSTSGGQANDNTFSCAISADGLFVCLVSDADNLVPGDTNNFSDVFVHARAATGPRLAKTGVCPGATTLNISDASPGGLLAILYGLPGAFTQLTPPCAGLVLGLARPALAALIPADGQGSASLNFQAPAGACGRSVQAVDVTSCVATNVLVL